MKCPKCNTTDPPLRSSWTKAEYVNGHLFMPPICENLETECCGDFPVQEDGSELTDDQEAELLSEGRRLSEEAMVP